MKSNESLSRMSSGRSVSMSRNPDSTHTINSTEGIYASIPAAEDEQYLQMNSSGVSMEDLLTSGERERTSSLLPAKSVIKRLQMFTSRSDTDTNGTRTSVSPTVTPKGSPGRNKRESGHTMLQLQPSRQSLDSVHDTAVSPVLLRGGIRSTMFNKRPLPQSPAKLRKSATLHHGAAAKRKNSFGDSNIYESIDGEMTADWLKQLKRERFNSSLSGNDVIDEEPADNTYYSQIMTHFLSNLEVQELWKNSVRSVYAEFVFPDQTPSNFPPPLLINPEYFSACKKLNSERPSETSLSNESRSSIDTTTPTKSTTEEKIEELQPSKQHSPLSKKESFTDQVLAKWNQRLQVQQKDSNSSSEEDSDSEYSDTSSDTGSDTDSVVDEEKNVLDKLSLSAVHECFETCSKDDMIILNNVEVDGEKGVADALSHLNGFIDNSWLELENNKALYYHRYWVRVRY